jgi:SWI/SNF-related matrix-associated actin-dependent regulator 1 of chromatin subfamily A
MAAGEAADSSEEGEAAAVRVGARARARAAGGAEAEDNREAALPAEEARLPAAEADRPEAAVAAVAAAESAGHEPTHELSAAAARGVEAVAEAAEEADVEAVEDKARAVVEAEPPPLKPAPGSALVSSTCTLVAYLIHPHKRNVETSKTLLHVHVHDMSNGHHHRPQ